MGDTMETVQHAKMKIGGGKLLGRLVFAFLVICSIALGAAGGLLFVYTSDLPEVHALEDYHPNVVTELYAADGQSIGTGSRILQFDEPGRQFRTPPDRAGMNG